MNGVTVAPLSAEAVSAAIALSLAVFPGGGETSLRACFTGESNRFFAATADGMLVGFGGYSIAADQADVIDVAVAPNFRRRGIARALVQAVLAAAQSEGAESIFLEVRASNAPALSLYTALGFTVCGVRKNYYKNPREDAVLMTCDLCAVSAKSVEE